MSEHKMTAFDRVVEEAVARVAGAVPAAPLRGRYPGRLPAVTTLGLCKRAVEQAVFIARAEPDFDRKTAEIGRSADMISKESRRHSDNPGLAGSLEGVSGWLRLLRGYLENDARGQIAAVAEAHRDADGARRAADIDEAWRRIDAEEGKLDDLIGRFLTARDRWGRCHNGPR